MHLEPCASAATAAAASGEPAGSANEAVAHLERLGLDHGSSGLAAESDGLVAADNVDQIHFWILQQGRFDLLSAFESSEFVHLGRDLADTVAELAAVDVEPPGSFAGLEHTAECFAAKWTSAAAEATDATSSAADAVIDAAARPRVVKPSAKGATGEPAAAAAWVAAIHDAETDAAAYVAAAYVAAAHTSCAAGVEKPNRSESAVAAKKPEAAGPAEHIVAVEAEHGAAVDPVVSDPAADSVVYA